MKQKRKNRKDDTEKMLTVSEAAEFLGVSKSTIRKLDKLGEIKSYRIGTGKHRRFKKEFLIKYLEENK